MVDRFIRLLVKWLTDRGYHILTNAEYAGLRLDAGDYAELRERLDKVTESVDVLSENVTARDANEPTAAQILREWLDGEGTQ